MWKSHRRLLDWPLRWLFTRGPHHRNEATHTLTKRENTMHVRHLAQLALTMLLLASSPAIAQTAPTNKGDAYAQAGGASTGRRQVLTDINVGIPLYRTAATGIDYCFPIGALGNLHVSNETSAVGTPGGEVVIVFALAPTNDLTFTGDVDTDTGCSITDSAGLDGNASCVVLGPSERLDQVPSYDALINSVGTRPGICNQSTDIDGVLGMGPARFPACANNTDCVDTVGAGATCDLPGDGTGLDAAGIAEKMRRQGCAHAIVQTDVDNSIIDWHFDQ